MLASGHLQYEMFRNLRVWQAADGSHWARTGNRQRSSQQRLRETTNAKASGF